MLPHSPELRRIGGVDADVVIIGHTHQQMVTRVGRPLVLNPGSAGQARDHANGKRLSFAVLDVSAELTVESVVVTDYDVTTDIHIAPTTQVASGHRGTATR